MQDDDFSLELSEDRPESERSGPPGRSGGGKPPSGGRGRLRLLAGLLVSLGLVAGGTAFWLLGPRPDRESAPVQAVASPRELISLSRAREIQQLRSRLRLTERSSHNQALVAEEQERTTGWYASRADLTLLTGLFERYLEITGRLYEVFRLYGNGYIEERPALERIFRGQVLGEFELIQRRKQQLLRRVSEDPAADLFAGLNNISHQDSLAVSAFLAHLESGNEQELLQAMEQANEARLQLRDFWRELDFHIRRFRVEFQLPAEIWKRYYSPWEQG